MRSVSEDHRFGPDSEKHPSKSEVVDQFARPIHDLRVSVTDRCNFRCGFCMPGDRKYRFLPKPEILTFEEIVRLTNILVELGVRKVRLTGGEPLLRADLDVLIRQLSEIVGISDLALTTNGYLLADQAQRLHDAGLNRLTVSLHSLDAETFGEVNGLGLELERVLDGMKSAQRVGIGPIKANAVVMKGVNEDEILPLARFGRENGYLIRFIEFMDVGTLNSWQLDRVVSAQEIIERIDAVHPVEPLSKVHPGEVADRYRYLDGAGEVGVISSVTQPFCGDCSRIRLAADGQMYTCLFATQGHDLRTLLRSGAHDSEIIERLTDLWGRRQDRYSELRKSAGSAGNPTQPGRVEMFRIGG